MSINPDRNDDITIGLNFLFAVPGNMGGMLSHVEGLVHGLSQLDSGCTFVFFLNRESRGYFNFPPEFEVVRTNIHGDNRSLRYSYEQTVLPLQAVRQGVDVLHCPGYVVPLSSPVPTVVTVHDMNYERIPENFSPLSRVVWSQLVPRSLQRAEHVVTVSSFSKREIKTLVEVPESKITVVPNAQAPDLPDPDSSLSSDFVDVTPPYVLYVSTTHPHKNHTALVRALPDLPSNVSLVFVGPERSANREIEQLSDELGVSDRVVMCGFVSQQTLATLYHNAEVYAHPSRYEGFGMPLLEAMYYDTPVVCSHVASLPDIAGDAAEYFNPNNPADIAMTLSDVLESTELQTRLIKRGRDRLTHFSWEQAAAKTVEICCGAVNDR